MSGWRTRASAVVLVVMVGTGCNSAAPSPLPSVSTSAGASPTVTGSGSPTGQPITTPTGGPTGAATLPPTGEPTPATSASPPPTGDLPAGIQFGEPEPMPAASTWGAAPARMPDPREQPRAPRGFGNLVNPATPIRLAEGANGWVGVGYAAYWNDGNRDGKAVGAIWHSRDGQAWQLIETRGLVGVDRFFAPQAVIATASGYVVAGTLSDDSRHTSRIAVLLSADGREWRLGPVLEQRWALAVTRLDALGDSLVLAAAEYVCDTTASHVLTFSVGAQLRLWRSDDAGAGWQPIDHTLSGVSTDPEAPAAEADCVPFAARQAAYATQGRYLGVVDGLAFMLAAEGDRAATTADLTSWTQHALPGAVPSEGEADVVSTLPVVDDEGALLLALGNWRDGGDRAMDTARQVIGWRLSGAGGDAARLPAAKPMILAQYIELQAGPPGEVWLVEREELGGTPTIRRSIAGPLVPWGTCAAPGPGADCSFSTAVVSAPGADLSGIDLRAARLEAGSDLAGANLSGAQLDQALIFADLSGSELTDVTSTGTRIHGSLAGARFAGSTLRGWRVDASVFEADTSGASLEGFSVWLEPEQSLVGHDFSGQSLRDFSFYAIGEHTGLRDADFTDADLTSVSFSVDLTGATFDGATLEDVYFGFGAICPDGEPPTSGVVGAGACRLP